MCNAQYHYYKEREQPVVGPPGVLVRNLTDLIRGVTRNFTSLDVLLPLAPFN